MEIDWDEILPECGDEEGKFSGFEVLPEFQRDLKDLLKKYSSLKDDLENFINYQLKLFHKKGIDNKGTFELTYVDPDEYIVCKSKKFTCKSLKGTGSKSGIRVIHAYDSEEDVIELVEIYYKGDKKNEDRERVKRHYG